MFIRIVVVGIDHWDDLTHRFAIQLNDHNPCEIFVVDNASKEPYPVPSRSVLIRLRNRVGYGEALNKGATTVSLNGNNWDWLLCCNNDCLCTGNVVEKIEHLRPDTIYGNEWKYSYDGMEDGLPAVVDSAYLLIPRKVWDAVGKFDPQMDAAFEEVDYCIRAVSMGYRLDVVDLPITHLNLHTRRELEGYDQRWEATRKYFRAKHPNREGVRNGN